MTIYVYQKLKDLIVLRHTITQVEVKLDQCEDSDVMGYKVLIHFKDTGKYTVIVPLITSS